MGQPSTRATDRPIALVLLASLALSSGARAQVPAQNAALAEALFQEGKKLMEQKRYGEACPKLAESQRLDPAGGTLLRLSLCHEQEGRTATAWIELQQALAVAKKDRNAERVALAQQALDRVTPRLSRLTVNVPAEVARLPGLVVKRDGVELVQAAWGVEAAVDPGEHLIEATAPEHKPFQKNVRVGAEADRQSIEVAPLAPVDRPPPLATASAPPPATTSAPSASAEARAPATGAPGKPAAPVLGYALGGVGLLSLGVGGYFGLSAVAAGDDARARCPQTPCSDRGGVDLNEQARRDAWISNVGIGVGLLSLGLGAYLVLRKPSASGAAWLAPAPGGASLVAKF